MKSILITGASGSVATELIKNYLNDSNFKLILITNHTEALKKRYLANYNVEILSIEQLKNSPISNVEIDVVIYTAFARVSKGNLCASSLKYLQEFLQTVKNTK